MKKPVIGFIKYDMTEKSGGDRVAALLSAALSKEFEVHLISINGKGELPYFSVSEQVYYAPLLEGHGRLREVLVNGCRRLRKYVKQHRIEVLFSMGGNVNAFLWYGGFCTGAKRVFCEHYNLITANSEDTGNALLRKLGAATSDKIITLTERDRRAYLDTYRLSADKVQCIHNWIDPALLERETAYDVSSKKILSVGRLCPQKGFDYLVDCAKLVFKRHPDWRWDIYGDGPDKDDIARRIAENGLENHVFLMGTNANLYELYPQYGIYAMTSRGEGLPMVLLEAKSCRLPIVSFDCPTGPSEIVRDGVDGCLVEAYDVEQFAKTLGDLMDDEKRRGRFSDHATGNFECFEQGRILRQWKDLVYDLTRRENV